MAVLWQKEIKGTRYEVRTAGNTRRLYTDGVFHSQYNPNRPLAGGIWDLLMLPAFFHPPQQIKRILVLGVGGGAVIRQLHRYLHPEEIIGVELNQIHIRLARRFFGISKSVAQIHQADAVDWLNQYQGQPFDMIIEDLFGEQDGEPIRAVSADKAWFNTLLKHLGAKGVLVMNFIGAGNLKDCAYFSNKHVARQFNTAFQLSLPAYENVIGVFLKEPSTSGMLRKRLVTTPGLNPCAKSIKLNYRIRQI